MLLCGGVSGLWKAYVCGGVLGCGRCMCVVVYWAVDDS